MGDQQGPRLCPKRAQIVALYTDPPEGATVLCVDELGPVTPRNFPPAPGWSPDGHRIKVPLNYDRGPEKVWVYGALCVRDGQALTQTASSRNITGYQELLKALDQTYPDGDLYVVADHLASHSSGPIRAWLADHPRIQHAFIPVGPAWVNLIEGWWSPFRRKAFAGESLADVEDIAYVTRTASSAAALCTAVEERRTNAGWSRSGRDRMTSVLATHGCSSFSAEFSRIGALT